MLLQRLAWRTVAHALPGSSSTRRSGAALAWLVTDPTLAGISGRYFDHRRREVERCAIARRADRADELYTTSLALAGIARDPGPDLPRDQAGRLIQVLTRTRILWRSGSSSNAVRP